MLRAEKAELIEDLSSVFRSSGVVVLTHYKGMTVAEMGDLRGQMRKVGASLRVTKNLLAKRALEGTAFEPMIDLFKGPTAIAVSADPTAARQGDRRLCPPQREAADHRRRPQRLAARSGCGTGAGRAALAR